MEDEATRGAALHKRRRGKRSLTTNITQELPINYRNPVTGMGEMELKEGGRSQMLDEDKSIKFAGGMGRVTSPSKMEGRRKPLFGLTG